MTTSNCGWPITWRSTTLSSSAPSAPIATTAMAKASQIVEPPPHHGHVGDEGAKHEQIALGRI